MQAQPRIELNGPINPGAAFDPPVVRPGQQAIYRLTFYALEQSIQKPEQLKTPADLLIQPGAQGQILQMTGSSLVPLTAFNYRVRASGTGTFTMPEFVTQVYGKPVTVPAARLEVAVAPPGSALPPARVSLELSATNLFVGQPVRARVVFPSSPGFGLQALAQVQLAGKGFIVDQGAVRQQVGNVQLAGVNQMAYLYETSMTPLEAGKLTVFAQGFTTGNRFSGPIIIMGGSIPAGQPQYTLLESDPVELNARPLPREGELPGFTGAIGHLSIDPPALATNSVAVGEPVKLAVRVRSDGNLGRVVAPRAPRVDDWQVLAPTSDEAPPQFVQARGFVEFNYTLVPLTENTKATPAIPFSYFDPEASVYKDITIPPLPIEVRPGAAPSDFTVLSQSGTKGSVPAEDEPVLSGLATAPGRATSSLAPFQQSPWYLLAQLVPAAAFFALWAWDRRRRFLEQHPEIILRRRARRALLREWRAVRQAARNADAQAFAAAAVRAIRVACAPHYPADPRALVGADVLELLRGSGAPAGSADAVRRFFSVTDASLFATGSTDATELLALQPELDQVLGQLESRL